MKNSHVLFVCGQNKLRSPTAEQVFADWPGIQASSAGLNEGPENPVTPELLAWADVIFVMEKSHRTRLRNKFRTHFKRQRIVCLNIADDYRFMDAKLVRLLKASVPRHL